MRQRGNPPAFRAGALTRSALLTAIALTIFLVEAQIPAPVPVPGIKLGLSNIVTVYAVVVLGAGQALLILSARIFLGAVFSGQMMTLLYSGGGGLLAWLLLALLCRAVKRERLCFLSSLAGAVHNVGQLLVAAGVLKTWTVLAYLPYLILAGVGAGLFTGLCAQFLVRRLPES